MEWFLIAFSSALLSAVSTISEKKILFKMDAFEFSLLNSLFNLLFTLPFLFFINASAIPNNYLLILFGKTVLNAAAFYFVMLSLKNLELSKALPLLVLTPGFIALFAFIFMGEIITLVQVLGMGMLLLGTYILEMQNKKEFLEPFLTFFRSKNYKFIGAALFLFTATSILDKYILKSPKVSPQVFLFYQQLFTGIIFLAATFVIGKNPIKILTNTKQEWWFWIILVAVLTIGYRYTQIEAIKIAPAVALVLAVKRISVFFAALIGGKLFNESKLVQKAIATAIMIAGTFLIIS